MMGADLGGSLGWMVGMSRGAWVERVMRMGLMSLVAG